MSDSLIAHSSREPVSRKSRPLPLPLDAGAPVLGILEGSVAVFVFLDAVGGALLSSEETAVAALSASVLFRFRPVEGAAFNQSTEVSERQP
jgi:hypothetical protein